MFNKSLKNVYLRAASTRNDKNNEKNDIRERDETSCLFFLCIIKLTVVYL